MPHVSISPKSVPSTFSCGVSTPYVGIRSPVNELVCESNGRDTPDICDIGGPPKRGERLRFWFGFWFWFWFFCAFICAISFSSIRSDGKSNSCCLSENGINTGKKEEKKKKKSWNSNNFNEINHIERTEGGKTKQFGKFDFLSYFTMNGTGYFVHRNCVMKILKTNFLKWNDIRAMATASTAKVKMGQRTLFTWQKKQKQRMKTNMFLRFISEAMF